MKVIIDTEKIGELVYEHLIGHCDFDETRAASISDDIENLILENKQSIEGTVKKADYAYKRTVKLKPIERHYEGEGEIPYIKYICPICEILGNSHQITKGDKKCSLCNVNISWDNLN